MSDRGGYIIEFHQVGHVVKVSAVDPASLTEVSIVGPADAGEAALRRTAVRKLEYVLRKPDGGNARSSRTGMALSPRRGLS